MNDNRYAKILSYRPNISFKKKVYEYSYGVTEIDENIIDTFIDNSPALNVVKLNNIIVNTKSILDDIEKNYFDCMYNNVSIAQYIDAIKDDKIHTADDIYEEAFYDIESNIAIEAYKLIHDEYKDLVSFDSMYRFINYGNENISTEEIQDIEKNEFELIVNCTLNSQDKVNYAALLYETKLNKMVEMRLETSEAYINNLKAIVDVNESDDIYDEDGKIYDALKMLFDKNNQDYERALNELLKNISFDSFKTLYEYIAYKLFDLYETLDYKDAIDNNIHSILTIDMDSIINEKGNDVDYYILEMFKMITNSAYLLEEYMDLINKKNDIKNFYNSKSH